VGRRGLLSRAEWALVAGTAALFALAVLAPALPQDAGYHRFADARTFFGIPRALDVVSSAGFAVLGMSGLSLMASRRLSFISHAFAASAFVFFLGLVVTGAASAAYHLSPDDAGLAKDRHAMAVVFAGVLGMVATERISDRAGIALAGFSLLAGTASALWWTSEGSVTPYAVLQLGGLVIVAVCLLLKRPGVGPHWALLLLAYALAKAFEHVDAQVFALTGEAVSGHTVKHLMATLAAWAVIQPLLKSPGTLHPASSQAGGNPDEAGARHASQG
jgi:hypothetical protein